MSAPQSVQEMVFMYDHLWVRGPHIIQSSVLGFYWSKCFVTPSLIGQYYKKNVVCLLPL